MNIQNKIKDLETKINFHFNKPRIFILFSEAGRFIYKGDSEEKIFYNSIDEFKQSVNFNPRTDLYRIVEFV
jgi:hypothetical protein